MLEHFICVTPLTFCANLNLMAPANQMGDAARVQHGVLKLCQEVDVGEFEIQHGNEKSCKEQKHHPIPKICGRRRCSSSFFAMPRALVQDTRSVSLESLMRLRDPCQLECVLYLTRPL